MSKKIQAESSAFPDTHEGSLFVGVTEFLVVLGPLVEAAFAFVFREEPQSGEEHSFGDPVDDLVPRLPIILTVDGQTFTITERDGGHDYNWDNGPNPDYGFSESAPQTAQISADDATKVRPPPPLPPGTLGHYRNSIRDFLSMIDPNTGYVEE